MSDGTGLFLRAGVAPTQGVGGLPTLPAGYAFVTYNGVYVTYNGAFIITKVS